MLLADEQVSSVSSAGNTLWALADHLGTIRDTADYDEGSPEFDISNHRVFDSFGRLESESNSAVDLAFGYTGKYTDEDTLYTQHLFRWYDPRTGRWLSEDPIGFAAGDSNLTRYVGNEAVGYVDTMGLFEQGMGYDGYSATATSGALKLQGPQDPVGLPLSGKSSGPKLSRGKPTLNDRARQLTLTDAEQERYDDLNSYADWQKSLGKKVDGRVQGEINRFERDIGYTEHHLRMLEVPPGPARWFYPGHPFNLDNLFILGAARGFKPPVPGFVPGNSGGNPFRPSPFESGQQLPGFRPPSGTRSIPEGVPSNWQILPSNQGNGVRFIDPRNPGNSVRVMPGNPNSPYPNSQKPYVRWQKNGQALDVNGLPVPKDSPEAHVPLKDFRFNPKVFDL